VTFEALHLKARWLGCQRIELESCGSTNDEAARLARAGASRGTVVIAERQTAGRGRDGRVWESPPGGLYMSIVLRPPLALVAVPPMTLAIGIGVCEAARAFGARSVLKWPNDLLVVPAGPAEPGQLHSGGRKLAGVLVEAQSQGNRLESVVVGIGINLSGELPDALGERAITLEEAAGVTIDRDLFIERLLADVERWVERYVAVGLEAIIPAWRERMALGLSARATPTSGVGIPVEGVVEGLDEDGALLLRDDDGHVHKVMSGDVEVIRAPSMLQSAASR
jgi:BirA family transcriptional regulator, biotin operon repressor / biotin---[acetyl-CoA-carboxylase] ligase